LIDRLAAGRIASAPFFPLGGFTPLQNYAAWESTAHYRTAFTHPEFKAGLAAYPSSVIATPHLFQTVAVPRICVA